jgi:hypothetical protein
MLERTRMLRSIAPLGFMFVGTLLAAAPCACSSSDGGGGAGSGGNSDSGAGGSDNQTGGSAGSGGGSAGAAGAEEAGACPANPPVAGSACSPGTHCTYGGGLCCGGAYTCPTGTWEIIAAGCACIEPQDASVPTMPPPDASLACGTQTCAPDEWCHYPCCGELPECMEAPEGSTCAPGFASCFTPQNVKGCRDTCTMPSCSKEQPPSYCTINGREVHCTCA